MKKIICLLLIFFLCLNAFAEDYEQMYYDLQDDYIELEETYYRRMGLASAIAFRSYMEIMNLYGGIEDPYNYYNFFQAWDVMEDIYGFWGSEVIYSGIPELYDVNFTDIFVCFEDLIDTIFNNIRKDNFYYWEKLGYIDDNEEYNEPTNLSSDSILWTEKSEGYARSR